MSLINQPGFYHGVITDAGLSQSTNGFPQEVLALKATEVYDPDTETYFPADPEADEITAYLILIDSKENILPNMKQLMKVTGWCDGSLITLANMSMVDTPIAFRVGFGKGEYADRLGVTWIDTVDAPPTWTVQKLDEKDVQALHARYASILATIKTPVRAISAPASAPTKPTAGIPPKPKPKALRTPKVLATPVGKCTADEAYNACHKLKRDDVTVDVLNEVWLKVVAAVNADESKITEEQWFGIKETILKQISKV